LNSRLRATILLLATVPGIVVAHPNAFVTLLLFAALMAAEVLLGKAWRVRRDRPRLAAAGYVFVVVAPGVALAASTYLGPKAMRLSGRPGPELPSSEAITDMLLFAPRQAAELWVLAALVAVGAGIVLLRHRGRRWLVAGMIITSALFYLNVAVDNPTARLVTWPWYNNAVRLAVIGVLPAALLATASLAAGARLVTKRFRLPPWVPAVTVALLFVVVTGGGYVQAHRRVLNPFFHPAPSHSWASGQELRALHSLARLVPTDAVVAENAWNGGSYMYVVSGRHMLFPTEKARTSGDRMLLALRLDEVGTSPNVCAAARRQRVRFAITGGRPFAWAGRRGTQQYAGVDAVGSSDAFRKVAQEGPFTLYQMVKCAKG